MARPTTWRKKATSVCINVHFFAFSCNPKLLKRCKARRESPETTWTGLVRELTEHYGSLGRLVDYRRQFERTAWKEGEDLSIFAIALETLPVKAFGTWVPLHDFTLYVSELLLAMIIIIVPCAATSIVCHQKFPSEIWLTVVECGIAM